MAVLAERVNILRVLKLAGGSSVSAKLTPHSIAILHRLVSHAALPPSAVPDILELLEATSVQSDDVKLRGLQCVMPLLAHFALHQEQLYKSYQVCFNMLNSKSPTVNNAAIAIIRQLVIWLFERVVEEDALAESQEEQQRHQQAMIQVAKADGGKLSLRPYAADAYAILQDICLLAAGKAALALPVTGLNFQFALELVESVLHDNPGLFHRRRDDFLPLLQERVCSFTIELLPRQHDFSVACRLWRIVAAILHNFPDSMPVESAALLTLLARTIEESQVRWEVHLALEVSQELLEAPAVVQAIERVESLKLMECIVAVCNTILAVLARLKNVDLTLAKAHIRLPLLQQFDRVTSPPIEEVQVVFAAFDTLSRMLRAHRGAAAGKTLTASLWASILRALKCLLTNNRLDLEWRHLVLDSMVDLISLESTFGLSEPLKATLSNLAEIALPEVDESSVNTSSEALILNDVNLSASLRVLQVGAEMGEHLQDSWAPIVHVLHGIDQLNVYRIKRSNSILSPLSAVIAKRSSSLPALVSGEMDILGQITEQARIIIESSSRLSPAAFTAFFRALCDLASELLSATLSRDGTSSGSSRLQDAVILFPFQKVRQVALLNVHRFCDPEMPESQQAWDLFIDALSQILQAKDAALAGLACESISLLVTQFSSQVDPAAFAAQTTLQERIFSALEKFSAASGNGQETQRTVQEALHRLLQHLGPSINTGWRHVFVIIQRVTDNREAALSLLKTAYASIKLVCAEFIALLAAKDKFSLVETVSQVTKNSPDLNMRLNAIGLLWDIADHARAVPDQVLWLRILELLVDLSLSDSPEVRSSALQTITRIIDIRGRSLGSAEWAELLEKIIAKLLAKVPEGALCPHPNSHSGSEPSAPAGHHHRPKSAESSPPLLTSPAIIMGQSQQKQWDETCKLLMTGVTQLYSNNMKVLVTIPTFGTKYWEPLLLLLLRFCREGSSELVVSAMTCFHRLLDFEAAQQGGPTTTSADQGGGEGGIDSVTAEIWTKAWGVWCDIGTLMAREGVENFNQDSLLGFAKIYSRLAVGGALFADPDFFSTSWRVLGRALRCPTPTDPVRDAESMTELQRLVFGLLTEGSIPRAAAGGITIALQIEILATWLSWLKPVDVAITRTDSLRRSRSSTPSSTPTKSSSRGDGPTFFALCRASLDRLEALIPTACGGPAGLEAGAGRMAMEAVGRLAVKKYLIPHGGAGAAPSLWKLATKVVNALMLAIFDAPEATAELQEPAIRLVDEIIRVAATMVPMDISPEQLEVDEKFDIEELQFVRETLLPRMTLSSPTLIKDLICTIERSSHLYVPKGGGGGEPLAESRLDARPVIKEKFAVACLYSLFAICADRSDDQQLPAMLLDRSGSLGNLFIPNISPEIRQVALPILVDRCRLVLASYTADKVILGRMPFPRVRQDEMLYILSALNRLRLPPESTLPAPPPAEGGDSRTEGDGTIRLRRQLLASPRGHLFFLYSNYCELLRIEEPAVLAAVQETFSIIGTELGVVSAL